MRGIIPRNCSTSAAINSTGCISKKQKTYYLPEFRNWCRYRRNLSSTGYFDEKLRGFFITTGERGRMRMEGGTSIFPSKTIVRAAAFSTLILIFIYTLLFARCAQIGISKHTYPRTYASYNIVLASACPLQDTLRPKTLREIKKK